jgi:L-aminopeptidase/D-esterase-like protein
VIVMLVAGQEARCARLNRRASKREARKEALNRRAAKREIWKETLGGGAAFFPAALLAARRLRASYVSAAAFGLATCLGLALLMTASQAVAAPAQKPRARDLGIPFRGTPAPLNAITDVPGVEVGEVTLISGSGALKTGSGPVRTGVTAILPRGKAHSGEAVFAGWFSQNGNGEMTGTTWIDESGELWGPVVITNTHSVGIARDAVIAWYLKHNNPNQDDWWSLPVVAETWDGWLNDINGFHVKQDHVFAALDGASGGPVPEGNVGGGTGMICYEFKGGTGTASRRVKDASGEYTLGVLVQANFGRRPQLMVAGVPMGVEIPESPAYASRSSTSGNNDVGSIIVVIAVDAPMLPHQLKRLARRASMGIARTGGMASNSSGDIFIAFTTANAVSVDEKTVSTVKLLPNDRMTPFFEATVEATEEAILNALVAAETMTGANDRRVIALPHDKVVTLLRKYNRLEPGHAVPRN